MGWMRKMAAIGSLVLVTVLICGCDAKQDPPVLFGEEAKSEQMQAEPVPNGVEARQEDSELTVYVCGAVVNPGVYTLAPGSRKESALLAAGGFAEDACREEINLAEPVTDGEKICFPTVAQMEASLTMEEQSGVIDINRADVAAFCTLPGIGESRAGDIVAYREKKGGFRSCEELMEVPGIKESTYNKIRDMICVRE